MAKRLVLSTLCMMLMAYPVFADPVGQYYVSGANPGNESPYKGTVDVQKTDETYRVIWMIYGQKYIGTGIGDDRFLAVSYKSGNDTGLAFYVAEGNDWIGLWTYANGTRLGGEKWERR